MTIGGQLKTIPEVSREHTLPQSTLRDARSRGVFPSQKVGRDWLIDEQSEQFVAWLAARDRQPRVKGKKEVEPPVQLRMPESINFGEKNIPVDEIAAIHDDGATPGYFLVILSNVHHAASYSIGKDHFAYKDVLALYKYRTYIWVKEDDEAIVFYAHDAHALAVLHKQLEQNGYRFTSQLGAVDPNGITVFRNQGEELEDLDRELELKTLVEDFRTPIEEADTDADEGE